MAPIAGSFVDPVTGTSDFKFQFVDLFPLTDGTSNSKRAYVLITEGFYSDWEGIAS